MKEWARISEIQDLIVNSGFHFAPHFAPRSKNPIPFELSSGSSPEILSKLPSADTMRQWLLSRSPKAESRTDSPKPPPVVRVLGKCRVCGKDVSSGHKHAHIAANFLRQSQGDAFIADRSELQRYRGLVLESVKRLWRRRYWDHWAYWPV